MGMWGASAGRFPPISWDPMDNGREGVGLDPTMDLLARHVLEFETRLGPGGSVRAFFSPGRVNLMGAHLDYNGGLVMPTAIDRGTFLALRARPDRRVRLLSTLGGDCVEFELDDLPPKRVGQWFDYPVGVLQALGGSARSRGMGFDVLFGGNLPVAAGLSSSASINVGLAMALDGLWGLDRGPEGVVRTALEAERSYVGVQCGIMDPYAVGLAKPGHLLCLDCSDASYEHLPFDSERLVIAVADTGVRRELAQSAFNERVEQCARAFGILGPLCPGAEVLCDVPLEVLDGVEGDLDPVLGRRARHVIEETERTKRARLGLREGRVDELGRGMFAAHRSLRDLYEVSVPELDTLVSVAESTEGVLGSRLTGAGFGGCAVFLLERDAAPELEARLRSTFGGHYGREPEIHLFGGDPGPREVSLA